MTRHLLIAALAAAALTACYKPSGSGGGGTPSPETPQVSASGTTVTVAPDPIQFGLGRVNVPVTWQLPPGSSFRFTADGIRFKEGLEEGNKKPAREEIVRCAVGKDGLSFSCLNLHTVPGRYKYDITVQENGKPPVVKDPIMIND